MWPLLGEGVGDARDDAADEEDAAGEARAVGDGIDNVVGDGLLAPPPPKIGGGERRAGRPTLSSSSEIEPNGLARNGEDVRGGGVPRPSAAFFKVALRRLDILY